MICLCDLSHSDEKSKSQFDLNLDYPRRTSKDSNQTF